MVIDFSDRLRELRLEKGYSQATLSQKITNLGQPLSEAALAKYESGRTIPNITCGGISGRIILESQ